MDAQPRLVGVSGMSSGRAASGGAGAGVGGPPSPDHVVGGRAGPVRVDTSHRHLRRALRITRSGRGPRIPPPTRPTPCTATDGSVTRRPAAPSRGMCRRRDLVPVCTSRSSAARDAAAGVGHQPDVAKAAGIQRAHHLHHLGIGHRRRRRAGTPGRSARSAAMARSRGPAVARGHLGGLDLHDRPSASASRSAAPRLHRAAPRPRFRAIPPARPRSAAAPPP
jgi:hypothetical protein